MAPSEISRTTSYRCSNSVTAGTSQSVEHVVKFYYDVHVEEETGNLTDALQLLIDLQDNILINAATELLNHCQEPVRNLEDSSPETTTSNTTAVFETVVKFNEISLKPLDIMLSPNGEKKNASFAHCKWHICFD